jgi:predicted HNH restriction endonuclease
MASWTEDIVAALTALGGTGSYDDIYAQVAKTRPGLPASWKDVIRRRIQDLSSDSAGFKQREDLFFSVEGLGRGIWGLRGMVKDSPVAVDLPSGNEAPGRAERRTYRVLRDTKLARQLKLLHRDRCQVCDVTLRISETLTYSEAHHIIPLGNKHNGPDIPGNIIVLCPNHHALCDLGAIPLNQSDILTVDGHVISDTSLKYHNERICRLDRHPIAET